MKFLVRTLGCKLNQLDTARLTAALVAAGHTLVDEEGEADWVFVNSCTVTAESDRKSRKAVRGVLRDGRRVAVFGCGPGADPEGWRQGLPGAMVFPAETRLFEHFGLDREARLFPLSTRTRLALAVQVGCDDLCTFCITRLARGSHRSEPVERVVEQVRAAHDRGIREVVLTGVNLAAWGAEDTRRPEDARLHELVGRLLAETGIPRLRLSSLGPQYLQPAFFELLAEPRICDYLHLSVQSGSVPVLERMQRGHGVTPVEAVAEAARRVRPDVALAADFIAGFPGETEREHQETLALVDRVGFAKLHVFPFSARAGTPAAGMACQLPPERVRERARNLRESGHTHRARFLAAQCGKVGQVLVEHDGTGLTTNYIRLRVPGGAEGAIVPMRINPAAVVDRH